MPGGRPLTLTDAVEKRFLKALKRTLYVETACDLVSIPRPTLYHWLKMGRRRPTREDGSPTREALFLGAVRKALAEKETEDVENIATDGSWQSSAWRLERRHPERWAGNRKEIVALHKALKELDLRQKELEARLRALDALEAHPEGAPRNGQALGPPPPG